MMKQINAHTANNPKYNDEFFIDKYVMLWAYGYHNGLGAAEGLYRTINEMGYASLDPAGAWNILDVGCGVGRTAADYASFFRSSHVAGIDTAGQMLARARTIHSNPSGETLTVDMSRAGFGIMKLPTQDIRNLTFEESTLEAYAAAHPATHDLITAVNLLDRLPDVPSGLKSIFSLLTSGGILVGCTPLNFASSDEWAAHGTPEDLLTVVRSAGFRVEVCFDGLPYREVLDGRGAYEEYPTLFIKAVKP